MVPGQKPFGGYPDADGRVLYGVNAGVVPGPWNPTNRGVDPYVAVRGANGWATEYVGLPADLSPDRSSFSSALGGADAGLRTFAFAGPGLCDPCFSTSPETGIPLRKPDGQLIQAMVGTNPPEVPNLKPEGRVAKMLSADGRHLVFGSQYPLVTGANASDGNLNIFDRDLVAGTTQLVSTTPAGTAMQVGMGVSELALSDDGSRILIGTKVSEDTAGNEYVRLYMHIGSSPNTVELAPAATAGVLFDGMTADGSRVFFTSSQNLDGSDADGAADVYEAEIGPSGGVTLRLLDERRRLRALQPGRQRRRQPLELGRRDRRLRRGRDRRRRRRGAAVGDLLLPQPRSSSTARGGEPAEPLRRARGRVPDPFRRDALPERPGRDRLRPRAPRREGPEFQTTPDGRFATFRSTEELTGVDNAGERSVFLYDGDPPSGGAPARLPLLQRDPDRRPGMKAEATLAGDGLSLTDDGRVFFNTLAPLGTEDTGGRRDVYEWVGGRTSLISSGIGRFDSELLTTTHDGIDAYFFTHDTLDANVDENGERTKIYDARTDGGFFELPVKPQCAASDECHGPGTVAAGPAPDRQLRQDQRRQPQEACQKGKVKRKGKCVKTKPKNEEGEEAQWLGPGTGSRCCSASSCSPPWSSPGRLRRRALEISEFETTASSSEAGGHPDLRTKFKLLNAGDPEIARDITFELPQGMFGNPSVLTQCTSVDFALDQCPPAAQAGLIVVRANYEGNPNYLLGTAPIYSVDPGGGEAARFAFIAPTLNIPIAIPVNVLSADGYRLRFTVSGITQLAPLAAADLTFWGFPAAESHHSNASRKARRGTRRVARAKKPSSARHTGFPSAGMPVLPFTGNPSVCGEELPTTLKVETYQSPGTVVEAKSTYEPITNCVRQTFKPVAQAKLTTTEADSPSGIDLIVKAPQPQSKAASPSQVRTVILNLPEGLTINPDAADGQSACSDADAGLGTEAPAHCPDNAKIGTITISSAALPNDLEGAIYFGEPKPGSQYRLLIIADGYGIRTKFLGDLLPDPKTGQINAVFKDLPQLPFDEYGIHLFASDRGVLATPTHCGIHDHRNRPLPLEQPAPGPEIAVRGRRSTPVPAASSARGKTGPSTRGSRREPRTRRPAASATSSSSSTGTTATSSSATSTSRCRRA